MHIKKINPKKEPATSLTIKRVVLDPTSKCNLKCPMCWGAPRGICKKTGKYIDTDMSLKQLEEILIFMRQYFGSNILTINGGEPLLLKNIASMLIMARDHGYATTLSTNGTLLKENTEILSYLDAISIPIDSLTQKTSSVLRAPLSNHHQIAMEAIRIINDTGKKIHVKLGTVVTSINLSEIIPIGSEIKKRKLQINTWKLFQYKAVGFRRNHPMRSQLEIDREKFDSICKAARLAFPDCPITDQPNDTEGLYFLIRPNGSITAQLDGKGNVNPDLGNILTDDKKKIIESISNVINPEAEAHNTKISYGLE